MLVQAALIVCTSVSFLDHTDFMIEKIICYTKFSFWNSNTPLITIVSNFHHTQYRLVVESSLKKSSKSFWSCIHYIIKHGLPMTGFYYCSVNNQFEVSRSTFSNSTINLFFASFSWKSVKVYWLARMGQNFDQVKRDNTFWPMPIILKGSVREDIITLL